MMVALLDFLAPPEPLRTWASHPHSLTIAAGFGAFSCLGFAAWRVARNTFHNEPGLSALAALAASVGTLLAAFVAASRLAQPLSLIAVTAGAVAGGTLFFFADHRRFVRDSKGRIVTDRWQIVLRFGGFKWTRDKANRHFFFTGDTGSGKTSSGMNGLLDSLLRHDRRLGGMVMANKGDEWFALQKLARRHGREADLIRLRPRLPSEPATECDHRLNVTGDARFPFTTRARILVDTAAALNPKDEKSFFKIKGSAHIGRALELLSDIGRPATATNAYGLLTSEDKLREALEALTELEPNERRIRLAETFEQTYLKHEAKEQRAGEIGTSQNYLEYLGTAEVAEVFSSDQPDTCSIADVDRGKIFCVDVPQDYTTERQYVFTVMKLLLYRHALRRYSLPPEERYALNQLIFVGDEFQNAITASHDGTSDFNVVDRLRDCWLMLIVSAQAFESLIPPQTKEQAAVLALNLKNLVMYRAASEADAQRCAEAIGRHYTERASRTVNLGSTSHTYQRVEEYRIKPHEFRRLSDHTAVIRHCTNGYRKVRLRPV